VQPGQTALDVGCGSGALTRQLIGLLGRERVAAVDPDEQSVEMCRRALPKVDVRIASAEALPFGTAEFDAALAQLVVPHLSDPEQGVAEMRRVARPGGVVGASVWDFGGGMTVLRTFCGAAAALDPQAAQMDQARTRPFSTLVELHELWQRTGLTEVSSGELIAEADYTDFDDLWEPLVATDGSPGVYYASLAPEGGRALRREIFQRLGSPTGPFRLSAPAWYVVGHA
jgi:ubiquinone/menaquinone biosynthesis C-methylase UbiE